MDAKMNWTEVLAVGDEIILTGELISGYLSYETRLFLRSEQWNLLINQIQLLNPQTDILDFIQTFQIVGGGNCYAISSDKIENSTLEMRHFCGTESVYQVRA